MADWSEIKNKIQGEVTVKEEDLEKYSRDASIFQIKPEAVAFPKNSDDLKALVKWAAEKKPDHPGLSLTARSGGTCMSGGSINDSVILDFTRHFNRVFSFGKDSVRVQPGVFYRDFEVETLKRGLLLPCYTASKSINTVGGMVGNNSAGEKTLFYGQTKDFVRSLKVVLSDGNEYTLGPLTEPELEKKMKLPGFEGQVYRQMFHLLKENYELIKKAKPKTSKNSAGYLLWDVWDKKIFDLSKLFCGSQGTLGLVTEIDFRLVKPKSHSGLLVMFLKNTKSLGKLVDEILTLKPESFESFDNYTFNLAMKFLPEMIKRMKGGAFKLFLQFLPELFMTVTGGIPKLVLIAEFTGDDESEIQTRLHDAKDRVEKQFGISTHITKSAQEAEKYWVMRRESFSLLRQHVKGLKTAPFIDDIAVLPGTMPEFLPKLNEILKRYPSLVYTIAGHAGNGNFHIIPLMDLKDEKQRAIIPKLSEEVYNLVIKFVYFF
jgi:FAD/FMN-containing dehydrogenase